MTLSATPAPHNSTVQSLRVNGATYESRLVCCYKPGCRSCNVDGQHVPSHGPYWYLCFTLKGKTKRRYLGKHLDTARFRNSAGLIDIDLVTSTQADRLLRTIQDAQDPAHETRPVDPPNAGDPHTPTPPPPVGIPTFLRSFFRRPGQKRTQNAS